MDLNRLRHGLVLALPLLIGLLGDQPAMAANGVIQINQARALAGNVTPGDAPGFPVEITTSGSYILTSALNISGEASPASVTAISVSASGVSIDLNGFGIIGATVCTGVPVTSCTPSGTGVGIQFAGGSGSVKGGAISGMGFRGIDMSTSNIGFVRNVGVFNSGENGILLPAGGGAERVTVSANGGVGILVGGGGVVWDASAFNNGGNGIQVGAGSQVKDSVSSNNGGSGISLGAAALAETCVANGNADAGITNVSGGIIRNSVTVVNMTDGIRVGSNATLTYNNSYSNQDNGIEAGSNGTAIGNVVANNLGFGLALGSGSGYQGNVVNSNSAGTVNGTGLTETGGNVCAGNATCP